MLGSTLAAVALRNESWPGVPCCTAKGLLSGPGAGSCDTRGVTVESSKRRGSRRSSGRRDMASGRRVVHRRSSSLASPLPSWPSQAGVESRSHYCCRTSL